ncbi:methyltransferase domain-containing protein [Congregibacter brevis]|uniref:Methyltransferase domain-containing protein n=1 Tax=Congregibacter brevis TaxID=3081201 RepID=A0ABZ0I8Z3_9GAMM|nr:methyltransferase domain-containing protein [Congregibacter sp. IMCC45268]
MSPFNSPLSNNKADYLIECLKVDNGNVVLDIGCGDGEFLIRLLEASDVRGIGVDINQACIATASTRATERLRNGAVEFRHGDFLEQTFESNSFDVVICIGASHVFDSGEMAYPACIDAVTQLLKPGGRALIGESYWKRPPESEYVEFIGEPVGIYQDHQGNVSVAESLGLDAVCAVVSSDEEWDAFEWSHYRQAHRYAAENPNTPAATQRLERSRMWRDGYLRWGRTTMGFGFYLLINGT